MRGLLTYDPEDSTGITYEYDPNLAMVIVRMFGQVIQSYDLSPESGWSAAGEMIMKLHERATQ